MASAAPVASTSANTALVAVLSDSSFDAQIVDLAAFLSRSLPEAQRTQYIESWSAKATQAEQGEQSARIAVVEQLVDDLKSMGDGNEREVEGAHNLLSAVIAANAASSETALQLQAKQVSVIVNDASAVPGRELIKYRVLSNIFNSLPASASLRETIFLALLDLAASNDDLDLISPALASLPHWLSQWSIPESQKASALETVAQKLESSEPLRAYDFRVAHLEYLSSTPGAGDASVTKTAAEKAIAAAIGLPKVFGFDVLLKLSAVDSLQSSSPAIFSLLKLLVQGSLSDWQSWSSSNGAELQRLSIDSAVIERKIRLLEIAALCSKAIESLTLASTAESQGAIVSYSDVASAIQVSEDKVEAWVIDVIRAGLVNGKLSQVSRTFRVYRSTYRVFGNEQWKLLEKRLTEWDSALEGILATLNTTPTTTTNSSGRGAAPSNVGIPGADAATVTTSA